jgi:hypothetical protein
VRPEIRREREALREQLQALNIEVLALRGAAQQLQRDHVTKTCDTVLRLNRSTALEKEREAEIKIKLNELTEELRLLGEAV